MNTVRWILALAVVALVGVFGGYQLAPRSSLDASGTVIAPDSGASNAEPPKGKVLYWRDPMKPEIRFDKPGKSPYMDMPLVPVYASGASDAGGIAVNPNMRQSLGIRIGRVERAAVATIIAAVGTVAYDEHRTTLVQARAPGFVSKLHVKAAQDRVRQGQALVDVTVPAWVEAEGEYLAMLNTESASGSALRGAARERLLLLGVPEGAVRALEHDRKAPASTTLYSPIDGVIAELGVREGAAFADGALLFRVNGLATVWVNAQVPESEAGTIAPGSATKVRATAWPGQVFSGRLEALLPQLDTATRTLTARIAVDNRDGKLTPGMFVNAELANRAAAPQLWVPSEAVIVTGQRSVVIRSRDDGAFEAIDVTIGRESGGKTAILSGLSEGQSIVLSGQFLIDSESSLKSAINRLSASPATAREPPP